MVLITIFALIPIMTIGTAESGASALAGLAIGAAVAGLFCLAHALFLPRLVIDLHQGILHTRTRTVPFSRIARIKVVSQRAGVWAEFSDDEGRIVARMALGQTLYAPPGPQQWAAVSRGGWVDMPPQAAGRWMAPARAVDIIGAQVDWCSAGHRSSHRRSPASALVASSIDLSPSPGITAQNI